MIGFVFFFLPNLNIIDIMPDFIGCLFIIKGLSKLSDLTPGLNDAKNAFTKVLYINIAKFLLMFTVPYLSLHDGGYILIFSFTFSLLDIIFTLPAFKSLLNGFLYLGNRTDSHALFKNHNEFSAVTTVFFIVRSIFTVLPDLSYISNPEYSGTLSYKGGFYISNYKTLLIGINFLVTGIIGAIWLYYSLSYLHSVNKDKKLISYLKERYNSEIITNNGLFIRRNIKKAMIFLTIGSILMIDVLIDLVNIVPDFLGGAFFLVASIILTKYVNSKNFVISSAVFTTISLSSWIVLLVYSQKYPDVNILSNFEAYDLFLWVNVVNFVKYVSLVFVLIYMFKSIKTIITEHTGSSADELDSLKTDSDHKQKYLHSRNKICMILGIICCISGIIRMILLYSAGEYVIIDFAINILWIVVISKLFDTVKSSVEYKYL